MTAPQNRDLTGRQAVHDALAIAERLVEGAPLRTSPTTRIALRDEAARGGPLFGLALAVLVLADELEAAGLADRSPVYQVDEARAGDGLAPPSGTAHATPRQVAEAALGRRLGPC